MTKKIIATSVVVGAMLTLTGCGGSNDTLDNGATNPVATGTAFYIDSAVSGVNYKCGSQEGITGADGSFTFEVGGGCTFYLGDMKLRGVDAGLMVNGKNVYETDVKIARILQSLDSDGNPANGITIEADTVKALADAGITKLPDTVAEMDEVLAVIAANGGTEVSEADAVGHMYTTLLGGKTFYAVGQEVSDATDIWGGKATFNANLTQLTYLEAYGSDAGETKIASISIDGNKLVFGNDTDNSYTVIGKNKGDYIEFTDYYSNGAIESNTRLYFDKTKADAYAKSLVGAVSPSEFIFTMDYLNGKTLYYVKYDDFGHEEQMGWNAAKMIFNANGAMVWNEIETIDSGAYNTTYSVDGKGLLSILSDVEEGSIQLTYISQTEDYLKVCDNNNNCDTYLFFDEAKALSFRDRQNGDTTTPVAVAYNGVFVDDAVDGVNFACGTVSGLTNSGGHFGTCPAGSTVTFSLGNVIIGSSAATDDGIFFVTDLVGTTRDDVSNAQVIVIATILQSLDSDGDPTNGVTIPADAVAAINKNVTTPVNLSELEEGDDFETTVKLTQVVMELQITNPKMRIVTTQEAEDNLKNSEDKINTGGLVPNDVTGVN